MISPDRQAHKDYLQERVDKVIGNGNGNGTAASVSVSVPSKTTTPRKKTRQASVPMTPSRPRAVADVPEDTEARRAFRARIQAGEVGVEEEWRNAELRLAQKEKLSKRVASIISAASQPREKGRFVSVSLKAKTEEFRDVDGTQPRNDDGKFKFVGGPGSVGAVIPKSKFGEKEWGEDHAISPERIKKRGYRVIKKSTVDENGDWVDDPIIQSLSTDPRTGGINRRVENQLRFAARQSELVAMPRTAPKVRDANGNLSDSPFGSHLWPEVRPQEPIISQSTMRKIQRQQAEFRKENPYPSMDPDERAKLKKKLDDIGDLNDVGNFERARKNPDVHSRFLYPPGVGKAARVDLPNEARNIQNFYDGRGRVHLVGEGIQKTDSVHGALDRAGLLDKGDSVIGIGSLTLGFTSPDKLRAAITKRKVVRNGKTFYEAPNSLNGRPLTQTDVDEIKGWLKVHKATGGGPLHQETLQHLAGRGPIPFYIDADGSPHSRVFEDGKDKVSTRKNVSNHARQMKVYLESRGVDRVDIVHPPLDKDGKIIPQTMRSGRIEPGKGIDDHLGGDETLRNLQQDKIDEPSKAKIRDTITKDPRFFDPRTTKAGGGRPQKRRADNLTELLWATSTLGGNNGISTHSVRRLALLLDKSWSHTQIRRYLDDLHNGGYLRRIPRELSEKAKARRRSRAFNEDWEDSVNFKDTYSVIVSKDWRSKETLEDYDAEG